MRQQMLYYYYYYRYNITVKWNVVDLSFMWLNKLKFYYSSQVFNLSLYITLAATPPSRRLFLLVPA